MIRAGVCPFLKGRYAIVIADGTRLVHAFSSDPIGVLVDRETPVQWGGQTIDKTRVIGFEDADRVAQSILSSCLFHDVRELAIELPPPSGKIASSHGNAIASAIADACRDRNGIKVHTRTRIADSREAIDAACRGAFANWPVDSYEGLCRAGMLLIESEGPRSKADRQPLVLVPAVSKSEAAALSSNGLDTPNRATLVETQPTTPRGPRTIGIDPGSHWTAWTIVEHPTDQTEPLRLILTDSAELGRLVDGKRELNFQDITAIAERLADVARDHSVTHAVIESVEDVYGADGMINVVRARELIKTERIVIVLQGAFAALGIEIETVGESSWHSTLVPGKKTKAERVAGLASVIEQAFGGAWPTQSNVHERDSAGVALGGRAAAARLRDRKAGVAVKRERARVPSKPKKERTPEQSQAYAQKSIAKRRDAQIAIRAAAGCQCGLGGRHLHDCPIHVARDGARVGKRKPRAESGDA